MQYHQHPPDDTFTIRCPRLGHMIAFSYCRQENHSQPCFKTLDCWFEHFPVEAHLKAVLDPEQWQRAFGRRQPPKVVSLVELIGRARGRGTDSEREGSKGL